MSQYLDLPEGHHLTPYSVLHYQGADMGQTLD